MAEFVDILHRDNARGPYNDMLLMHSPRMEGSQIFMGPAITPSSLCKGMDEPFQAGLPPQVDYKDVFGGPPRFVALMSVPHTPTATLDEKTARQLSLRTSSLPVFDLPVFGDNAFSSTVYEARDNSDVYDDTFDEEGPMPDTFSAFKLRSKASSLSSSRRMSPVHPAVSLASQPGGDETLEATSSTPILKTRPAAGKFPKRGSLSTASSFDEISGKLGDSSFASQRNDAFTSSLPSSPPQSGSFGHSKSVIGSSGSINIGASTRSPEVDDVFGGFPKRIFPQPLSAVAHDSRTGTNSPETPGTRALEKAGVKSINMESRSSCAVHASEISDTKKCNFSRSSSVNSCRDQHDGDDMHLSFQSSFNIPTPTPPPVPNTELKFKSWKDLVSDLPTSHSSTSRSIIDLVSHSTPPSMVAPTEDFVKDKDVAESLDKKQFDKNLPAQQNTEKLSQTSAVGHKGKFKSTAYTIDLEERELQALLANAWKINEQMERENYNAKFPEEAPKVSQVKDLEQHWEEQRKHSAGQPKSSRIQQYDSVDFNKRDDDINWKECRKYGHRNKRELSRDVDLDESSLSNKDFNFKKQVSAPDMARSFAETDVSFGAAKSVTEEVLVDHVLASFEVSPDALAGLDSQKNFSKGVSRECTSREYLVNDQALGRSNDFERVIGRHGSISGSSQDFVNNDEQTRLSFCVPVEDAECLIDLASSLDGVQEVEGETCERRKSRWERHMQARERVAKALEELQHRDAELRRQQEEKLQFSETSDGKIKRWAAGKEENLRALLSNLQHVLWSECGWQPIPLTDLIEVPDVKKAYRKATLVVHPDKVQQKGASIQQKYIAERVFDILQEAWKTFNLQESF